MNIFLLIGRATGKGGDVVVDAFVDADVAINVKQILNEYREYCGGEFEWEVSKLEVKE